MFKRLLIQPFLLGVIFIKVVINEKAKKLLDEAGYKDIDGDGYRENKNGEQEIIDGQQRITSIFLLLRAIYTKLSKPKEKTEEAKNFINKIEPLIWKTNK